MVFNSQQLCLLNECQPTMGCRVQQQQIDKRSSSKVKGLRPINGQHKQLMKIGGGVATKVGVDDQAHVTSMTSQEIKIPVYANASAAAGGGGGHRSPQKGHLTSKSPSSRASPGSMAMAAYAGAKFSAAPPSPHALPKPPISWVNPVNPSSDVVAANSLPCLVSPSMTSAMYGNLISNQLKLLLNVQA